MVLFQHYKNLKIYLKEEKTSKYIYNEAYHKACEIENIEESTYTNFYYDEMFSIKQIKSKFNSLICYF